MPSPEIERKLNELEPRIADRLQMHKRGQTLEELGKHLNEPQGLILSVLYRLQAEGHVTFSDGAWKLTRQSDAV